MPRVQQNFNFNWNACNCLSRDPPIVALDLADEEADSSDEQMSERQTGDQVEDGTFESFSLSHQLLTNLSRQELSTPTPVQHAVIPKIRNERGGDICINAPTGSGKTLAYALPIIEVRFLKCTLTRFCLGERLLRWDVLSLFPLEN
jgi:DEAD/DEAH box helicase